MIDRAEMTGFGVAALGHLALLAALTLMVSTVRPAGPGREPIEVALVDEAAPESMSPTPTAETPAPLAGPRELPPAPAVAPSPPAMARLAPQPEPAAVMPARPAPIRPAAPAAARPAPAPPKPARPRRAGGGLDRVVAGLTERETTGRSADAPAATAGPEVKASLVRLVREQLRDHWKSPSGADAELLRTELSIWLARDGSVTKVEVIGTTGQTASNRPQVKLHQEQALRAVRLATPFRLPDKYYDTWKFLSPIGFDRRLSR